jgi:hypothetical protein
MTFSHTMRRLQGGEELVVASTTAGGTNPGRITCQSGSYGVLVPVQTLGTSQVATNVAEIGYTSIVASTTAPAYTLAGPSIAGLQKMIRVESNTSSGTAVLQTSSTGVTISSSGNQLTFNAVNNGALLVSVSTAAWRMIVPATTSTVGTQST